MNIAEAQNQWVAIYIFFDGSVNSFLSQEIHPLTLSLKEKGLIRKYFFIRYYEGGQHIRLRCNWANEDLEEQLRAILENWAAGLINRDQPPGYNVTHYEFQQYIPELERYGGTTGISICEDFFCACSQIALNYIHQTENITYEQTLAFAFKLHISFVLLMESDIKEQKTFFHEVFLQWAERAQDFLEKWYGKPGNYLVEAGRLYEKSFESQKDLFNQIASDTIKEISGLQKADDYMHEWKQAVLSLRKNLYSLNGYTDFNSFKYILWSVVHMTNNRLGISNMDESFLGYVLRESIESINHLNAVTNASN